MPIMPKHPRAWRVAAIALAAVSLALLVLGIVPLPGVVPLAPKVELWQAELSISWAAPATPPPPGMWAGQTSHYGFQYNRYSDGSGYRTIPLWLFAIPFGLGAVLVARRAPRRERGFPVIRIALLATVPLVLGLLWMRTAFTKDVACIGSAYCLRLERGRIIVLKVRWLDSAEHHSYVWVRLEWFGSAQGTFASYPAEPALDPPGIENLFGFAWDHATAIGQSSVDAIAVPFWPLVLLSAIPSIMLLRRHRRYVRRVRLNLCTTCGYDLRESPQMCPECGAPAGARRAAPSAASSAAI